jgi:ribosomal protein S18 acetylase RimI-like enzyme
MDDQLRYTVAEEGDIPALVRLVNKAYRGDSSRKGWTTEANLLDGIRTSENSMREMITDPAAVVLKFSTSNNNLVGCVYLQKQGGHMYLGMLTVDPELQAAGLGRRMLRLSEDYARSAGCLKIRLTVITAREELINWYERRGYSQTPERLPFPDDPRFGIPKQQLQFLVMERVL